MLTCCGVSCCLNCNSNIVLLKIGLTKSLSKLCPFCKADIQKKKVNILPNISLQRLFDKELIKE